MVTGSPLALHKAYRCSFYQFLQLVRCFDSDPGNPRVAAMLSLLFQRLQLRNSLERLSLWLQAYVSPFISESPRSQTDQPEKVLAVAAYLFIADQAGLDIAMPESHLSAYIQYASRQSWFGDSFLAFFCSSLRGWAVCQAANTYFRANFKRFLSKNHIPTICQAVITLDADLPEVDIDRSLTTVCSALSSQDVSLNHAAWGLMALSRHIQIDTCRSVANDIAELIDERLGDCLSDLLQESRLHRVLAMIWAGAEQADVRHYVESLSASECDPLDRMTRATKWPSLADVGLALIALHTAGRHELLGVVSAEQARLISSLQQAHDLNQEGSVVLSRSENVLGSMLAITVTFVLGSALALYFLGGDIHFAIDLSKASWRNIDDFLWGVVWVDYMIAQIQALLSGGSAIRGLLQIPLLRHFPRARKQIQE